MQDRDNSPLPLPSAFVGVFTNKMKSDLLVKHQQRRKIPILKAIQHFNDATHIEDYPKIIRQGL